MNDLLSKIEEKTANIAVIGLGYVGLPLAVDFAKAGFHVVGIDKNQARANAVDNGRNYIGDVSDDDLNRFPLLPMRRLPERVSRETSHQHRESHPLLESHHRKARG